MFEQGEGENGLNWAWLPPCARGAQANSVRGSGSLEIPRTFEFRYNFFVKNWRGEVLQKKTTGSYGVGRKQGRKGQTQLGCRTRRSYEVNSHWDGDEMRTRGAGRAASIGLRRKKTGGGSDASREGAGGKIQGGRTL